MVVTPSDMAASDAFDPRRAVADEANDLAEATASIWLMPGMRKAPGWLRRDSRVTTLRTLAEEL